MAIKFSQYVLPLAVAKEVPSCTPKLLRFAGSAFYVNSKGNIATCAHNVEPLEENEILIVKELTTGEFLRVKDVLCHDKYDFAVGRIDVSHNPFLQPFSGQLMLGIDVDVWAFTLSGKEGSDICVETLMLRGYVARHSNTQPGNIRGKTTCQLSFPSLPGFSGAPVIMHKGSSLLGMLYNNIESSIVVYSYSEVKEEKETYIEKTSRIVEFGVMHPVQDLRSFLADLEIKAFE